MEVCSHIRFSNASFLDVLDRGVDVTGGKPRRLAGVLLAGAVGSLVEIAVAESGVDDWRWRAGTRGGGTGCGRGRGGEDAVASGSDPSGTAGAWRCVRRQSRRRCGYGLGVCRAEGGGRRGVSGEGAVAIILIAGREDGRCSTKRRQEKTRDGSGLHCWGSMIMDIVRGVAVGRCWERAKSGGPAFLYLLSKVYTQRAVRRSTVIYCFCPYRRRKPAT